MNMNQGNLELKCEPNSIKKCTDCFKSEKFCDTSKCVVVAFWLVVISKLTTQQKTVNFSNGACT